MPPDLSPRLAATVDGLALRYGVRVLEIGRGPAAAARAAEIASGLLSLRRVAKEDSEPGPREEPFHRAFAVRVGASMVDTPSSSA